MPTAFYPIPTYVLPKLDFFVDVFDPVMIA
jgi:hypothetical protein